jgi:hypothetical protein
MNKKLTLLIDTCAIENAKIYAKTHQTSVSKMVENFLLSIDSISKVDGEIGPLTRSLVGKIDLPLDLDYKLLLKEAKEEIYD